MNEQNRQAQGARAHEELEKTIRRVLERNRFAVLATQHGGQPHASLVAFTPKDGLRKLLFATLRGTLKYHSLREDSRVAVLIEDRHGETMHAGRRIVLAAHGEAIEIPDADREAHITTHLARHPDLKDFVRLPDCALVGVTVDAY